MKTDLSRYSRGHLEILVNTWKDRVAVAESRLVTAHRHFEETLGSTISSRLVADYIEEKDGIVLDEDDLTEEVRVYLTSGPEYRERKFGHRRRSP